jgi:hypothetical protein
LYGIHRFVDLHRRKKRSLPAQLFEPAGQVNTTLAATPLRRATSATFAPGANVFSTIRALSSCDQRRRRSNPRSAEYKVVKTP